MFRRNLISLLLDQHLTVPQIARLTAQKPLELLDDLRHLFLSLRHTEYYPDILPAECRKCGFEFPKDKLTKPSKCPKCRSTWLNGPQIGIKIRVDPAKERRF